MNTLFLSGVPNDGKGAVVLNAKGQSNIMLTGSSNLERFLADLQGNRHSFCLAGSGGAQPFNIPFWPDVIVNQISDADTHRLALGRCVKFCKNQNKPVVNNPEGILQTRRDLIYKNLAEVEGLNVPKTTLFSPNTPADVIEHIKTEEFEYPVMFRQAGDHGGISTQLINAEADIEALMYKYPLDGRNYYLTQFVDYASADGKYRKCRIVVVDGVACIRHQIISDDWLIHSASREYMRRNPQYEDEEIATLLNFESKIAPTIKSLISTISEKLQLEYFGIDCCFTEDKGLLAFEINANMNVMSNPAESPNRWETPIENIRQRVKKMICRKADLGDS